MFKHFPHITLKRQLFKLPDNLWNIRHTDISNGITCIFLFPWRSNVLETQRGNQTLSWSSLNCFSSEDVILIFFILPKSQRYVQVGVLPIILDFPVFINIVTTTIFHVYMCELTRCELFLLERLPSGANMINTRWCYNCYNIHVRNICITKLWPLISYFLYWNGLS